MKTKRFRLYRLPIWAQAIFVVATIAGAVAILQGMRLIMWIAYGISKGIL